MISDAERQKIVKSFLALLVEEGGVEKVFCVIKNSIKESAKLVGESEGKIEYLLLKKFKLLLMAFFRAKS